MINCAAYQNRTAYAALVIRADWEGESVGERQEVQFSVEPKGKDNFIISVDRATEFKSHLDGRAVVRYYRKRTGKGWYFESEIGPRVYKDYAVTVTPSPGCNNMAITRNPEIDCGVKAELRK